MAAAGGLKAARANRLYRRIDTGIVLGLPRLRQLGHPPGFEPHLLAVVHADKHHDCGRLQFVNELGECFRPVAAWRTGGD